MKTFKDFITEKKKVEPVLIPVAPVHGSHSRPRKHKKKLKEEADTMSASKYLQQNENSHLGKDDKEVDKALHIHDLSKHKHFDHVNSYTDMSYQLNKRLLGLAKGYYQHESEDDRKSHDAQVHGLDTIINDHKIKHDVHVYHGTDAFNPGKLASEHPERKIKSAAYLSTSTNKGVAHNFTFNGNSGPGRHIIHIHMKAGQKGLYVGSHSWTGQEHEMILPRDTTLKVHHEPTKLGDGTHVWHAHVVD